MSDHLLFSVAGARGIVGKTIDESVVDRLTRAFCSILPDGPIAIGRDTRPSGASFIDVAKTAIVRSGRDCIDLGIATTPTVEMATESSDAVAGIIVTASHNPVEWNALKFIDHRGIFIAKEVGDRLFAAFESGPSADAPARGVVREHATASREHVDAILALEAIDVAAIQRRRFKVVLDCINGAGSVMAPELLGELGCDVTKLNCKTDGDFYRDPEPRPENLEDLARGVADTNADIGFAADPDADRLALVLAGGESISEEYTLALAIDQVLSQEKGPVVVNVSTSSLVDHVAAKHGVEVHRTPVGEAHVVARLLSVGGPIGGEGNGGVIYPALHPGRDAPLGMAFILQLLAERGVTLREIIRTYPPFFMEKTKVELRGEFSVSRICDIIAALDPVTIDTQDGVKALFDDGWLHLRVSNTEGVVRVITEASTEEKTLGWQQTARNALDTSWGKI